MKLYFVQDSEKAISSMIKDLEVGWKEIQCMIDTFKEGIGQKSGPKAFLMKTKSMIERGQMHQIQQKIKLLNKDLPISAIPEEQSVHEENNTT